MLSIITSMAHMRFQKMLCCVILTMGVHIVMAQPTSCIGEPQMTSFCNEACIICDIDGFNGRHESTIVGESPADFEGSCTFVAHNMQWISFIAGSSDLVIDLSVSNCTLGNGLEVGIYFGIDCANYRRVSNCFGGASGIIRPGGTGRIMNNEPLIIGQYYWLVMDGGLEDNCDWNFTVIEGSTQVEPIVDSGEISGLPVVCPNTDFVYETQEIFSATNYLWTLNGVIQADQTRELTINFEDTGTFQLCVVASNVCNEGPQSCTTIEVQAISPTEVVETVCENECYQIDDMSICESGNYNIILSNSLGCDSLINLDLSVLSTPETILDINICEGDEIMIGEVAYNTTGTFQEVLQTQNFCDSIVNLELFVVICEIEGSQISTPPACRGESNASIEFSVDNGTPPFNYDWEKLGDPFISGTGNIFALNQTNIINNISSGTYIINIEDNFTNQEILIIEIAEPDSLLLSLEESDFLGFGVSCAGAIDGNIQALATGGVTPYMPQWNTGQTTLNLENLSAGSYEILLTDANGCVIIDSLTLTEPDNIEGGVDKQDLSCQGINNGILNGVDFVGGVAPYDYSIDGTNFQTSPRFEQLRDGFYDYFVRDANGCLEIFSDTIIAPLIPDIELVDFYELELGDSIKIFPDVLNNVAIQTSTWAESEDIDCLSCLNPVIKPLDNTRYFLEVLSEDGCADRDSVVIFVEPVRPFFAPNAFTPNQDGENDLWMLQGGKSVSGFNNIQILDRWGNVHYDERNLSKNPTEDIGWDGTANNGRDLIHGVYIWLAEIAFIDGFVEQYSGTITLIR